MANIVAGRRGFLANLEVMAELVANEEELLLLPLPLPLRWVEDEGIEEEPCFAWAFAELAVIA